jgi:endonuclease/exonuclease/phosphatase family metal-dependent hydrolase
MDLFSIVTFNTWKCDGDYDARLPIMVAEIVALDPDIVLLQEAFSIPGTPTDTARSIAEALGHQSWFHPMRGKERWYHGTKIYCHAGLAILSRRPMAPVSVADLPSTDDDGERAAQFALVEIPELGPLLIVNTHLVPHQKNEDVRIRSVERLLFGVRNYLAGEDGYAAAILGGDFNAVPDQPAIASLFDFPGLQIEGGFGAADRHPATLKFVTKLASASRPEPSCVDHVFLVQTRGLYRLRILAADRVLDREDPESGLYPSDHFGIRAWLGVRAATSETPVTSGSAPDESKSSGSLTAQTRNARNG